MRTLAFMASVILIGGASMAQPGSEAAEQQDGLQGTADLSIDQRIGEMGADGPYEEHAAARTDIFLGNEYTGMGGPLEDETEYPPCRPGPGDDRCIQLYE
jgi:hypothetical protein